jgi:hypothetical protein
MSIISLHVVHATDGAVLVRAKESAIELELFDRMLSTIASRGAVAIRTEESKTYAQKDPRFVDERELETMFLRGFQRHIAALPFLSKHEVVKTSIPGWIYIHLDHETVLSAGVFFSNHRSAVGISPFEPRYYEQRCYDLCIRRPRASRTVIFESLASLREALEQEVSR